MQGIYPKSFTWQGEPRSTVGTFIGYSDESKAYRVWVPKERRVDIARDVKFMEGHRSLNSLAMESLSEETDETSQDEVEFLVKLNDKNPIIVNQDEQIDETDDTINQNQEDLLNRDDDSESVIHETLHRNESKRGRGRPRKIPVRKEDPGNCITPQGLLARNKRNLPVWPKYHYGKPSSGPKRKIGTTRWP